MNDPAACHASAADSDRAVGTRHRPARFRDGRRFRGAALFVLALVAAVTIQGPAARGAEPWPDDALAVESIGEPGSAESFDSVLLRTPGSGLSEAVIGEDVTVDDGVLATDDAVAYEPGVTATDAGPVMFADGLEMLCPDFCRRCCEPRWSVQVDALMLWRSDVQSVPLLVGSNGIAALDADQVQPGMSAGPRVGVMRRIGPCAALEGNYFNVAPFTWQKQVPPGGPFTMTNFGDLVFNDITSAALASDARIQSAEFNYRRSMGPALTWITGFRWVQWNEDMTCTYLFANPKPPNLGGGSVRATTGNDLYGGQIGLDAMLWDRGGAWKVNGVGKAGVYYNWAYQRSTAGFIPLTGPPYPLPTVSADTEQVAFFGEVGLNSTYWITPWLGWRAGYSLFWLTGVAVAPEQYALASYGSGTTGINSTGTVFLQGVNTGLEARW